VVYRGSVAVVFRVALPKASQDSVAGRAVHPSFQGVDALESLDGDDGSFEVAAQVTPDAHAAVGRVDLTGARRRRC
jgi:hypothetical protein